MHYGQWHTLMQVYATTQKCSAVGNLFLWASYLPEGQRWTRPAVGETRARSATFSKIDSGWHTFSSWRLIPFWLVMRGKSFKWCEDGFTFISVISTLASILCWYLPHLTVPVPYMGQVLSHMGAHFVSVWALLYITGCHAECPCGIERTFHSSSSWTI